MMAWPKKPSPAPRERVARSARDESGKGAVGSPPHPNHLAQWAGGSSTVQTRRALLSTAIAVFLAPLAGCGWAPLYADRAAGPADKDLAAIKVAPIPERIGQTLALELRQWLNPNGDPVPSRYVLRTLLQTTRFDLGILSIGTGTRARFDAVATFTLIDLATGSQLFTASTHTGESFDILSNYYSDVVAEQSVRERAAKEISRNIVTQLTAFLQRRAALAAAPP